MNYKKLPEQNTYESNRRYLVPEISLAFILGVLVCLGYNLFIDVKPQQNCTAVPNLTYWEGYNWGMYDVSESVINNGIVPSFNNSDGHIVFNKEISVRVIMDES